MIIIIIVCKRASLANIGSVVLASQPNDSVWHSSKMSTQIRVRIKWYTISTVIVTFIFVSISAYFIYKPNELDVYYNKRYTYIHIIYG